MYLLIDGNHLAYRYRHAQVKNLRTKDGRRSGVVYGFLRGVSYAQRQIGVVNTQTVVVWDGGRSEKRKEMCPEYKSGRVKKSQTEEEIEEYEDFLFQLGALDEVLPSLGIRTIRVKGCEADDLIAIFARMYVAHREMVVIYTGDKDFDQLVSDDILLFHPEKEIRTKAEVLKTWDAESTEEIVMIRSLAGDDSDRIAGIRGIGEKKAKVVLAWLKDGMPQKSEVCSKAIQGKFYGGRDIYERNQVLMRLPESWDQSFYTDDQAIEGMKQLMRKPTENTRAFHAFCMKWDLQSMIDQIP